MATTVRRSQWESSRRGDAEGDVNDMEGDPTGPPPRLTAPSRRPSALRSSNARASFAPTAGMSERERTVAAEAAAGDSGLPDPLPERRSGRKACGR